MRKLLIAIVLLFLLLLLIPFLVDWYFDQQNDPTATPASETAELPVTRLPDSVADATGNHYAQLQVGTQIWLKENLRSMGQACNSGTSLQLEKIGESVQTYADILASEAPRVAHYDNTPSDDGLLYNYSALTVCRLCPPGFRLPTRADWQQLIDALGRGDTAARALLAPKGMNLPPAGRLDAYGSVLGGKIGFYWTRDTENGRAVVFEVAAEGFYKFSLQDVRIGCYVRCVGEG